MLDKEGNLCPLMLSNLIAIAQTALAKYGDMPVWVHASSFRHDDIITVVSPVSESPIVNETNLSRIYNYLDWAEKYRLSFVIESETV